MVKFSKKNKTHRIFFDLETPDVKVLWGHFRPHA